MAVPQLVRTAYEATRPALVDLDRYVSQTLETFARRNRFGFSHRIKDLESVSEKLETGRIRAWRELDDLVACTIVIPNADAEATVVAFLDSAFTQATLRSRATAQSSPDVFRYNATRWYGHVRGDPAPEIDPAATEVIFEVQVQTAFESAWTMAFHDLIYKGDRIDWGELRLAASVKALVEQIDVLLVRFVQAAGGVVPSQFPETDAKAHVIRVFQALLADGKIDSSLTPQSWRRFAENVYDLVRSRHRGREAPVAVRGLVDGVADAVRRGTLQAAISGSLFQMVIAHAYRTETRLLDRFNVVPSNELAEFYELPSVPSPISF